MADYSDLPTRALIEAEQRAAAELKGIHEVLQDRGHMATDMSTDPAYALATHYFDQLMRHDGLGPGTLGAVATWFKFRVDRELERRARASALMEMEQSSKARLDVLRAAGVSD